MLFHRSRTQHWPLAERRGNGPFSAIVGSALPGGHTDKPRWEGRVSVDEAFDGRRLVLSGATALFSALYWCGYAMAIWSSCEVLAAVSFRFYLSFLVFWPRKSLDFPQKSFGFDEVLSPASNGSFFLLQKGRYNIRRWVWDGGGIVRQAATEIRDSATEEKLRWINSVEFLEILFERFSGQRETRLRSDARTECAVGDSLRLVMTDKDQPLVMWHSSRQYHGRDYNDKWDDHDDWSAYNAESTKNRN